jgi:hypothetical protein
MKSRIAEQARQAQVADVRRMTAEQRLMAYLTHCQLMAKLRRAGSEAPSGGAARGRRCVEEGSDAA